MASLVDIPAELLPALCCTPYEARAIALTCKSIAARIVPTQVFAGARLFDGFMMKSAFWTASFRYEYGTEYRYSGAVVETRNRVGTYNIAAIWVYKASYWGEITKYELSWMRFCAGYGDPYQKITFVPARGNMSVEDAAMYVYRVSGLLVYIVYVENAARVVYSGQDVLRRT